MYTWERPFQKKVSALRNKEVYILRKVAVVIAVALFLSFFSPFMVHTQKSLLFVGYLFPLFSWTVLTSN
jgi:hypothetical protein